MGASRKEKLIAYLRYKMGFERDFQWTKDEFERMRLELTCFQKDLLKAQETADTALREELTHTFSEGISNFQSGISSRQDAQRNTLAEQAEAISRLRGELGARQDAQRATVEDLSRNVTGLRNELAARMDAQRNTLAEHAESIAKLRGELGARQDAQRSTLEELAKNLAALKNELSARQDAQRGTLQEQAESISSLRSELSARQDAQKETLENQAKAIATSRSELSARQDAQRNTLDEQGQRIAGLRGELSARQDAQRNTLDEQARAIALLRGEVSARQDAQHNTQKELAAKVSALEKALSGLQANPAPRDHWMHPEYHAGHVEGQREDRMRLLRKAIAVMNPESRVLDLGPGNGFAMEAFLESGHRPVGLGLDLDSYLEPGMRERFDLSEADYLTHEFSEPFDAIWASHVLEHQLNPHAFIEKMFRDLKDNGWLFVLVPPMKAEIVGGHVNLFNTGLLLYRLVVGGFDCSEAMVTKYGYNVVVFVRKKGFELPKLRYDQGDIERLAPYFPLPVAQNFNGLHIEANWNWSGGPID